MSMPFVAFIEYDGENPIRNHFVCEIENANSFALREWEDLHGSSLCTSYNGKKDSLQIVKHSDRRGATRWAIDKIPIRIEALKKEIELDTQLEAEDIKHLEEVAEDLQYLHEQAMQICEKKDLPTDKCNITWWIDY